MEVRYLSRVPGNTYGSFYLSLQQKNSRKIQKKTNKCAKEMKHFYQLSDCSM